MNNHNQQAFAELKRQLKRSLKAYPLECVEITWRTAKHLFVMVGVIFRPILIWFYLPFAFYAMSKFYKTADARHKDAVERMGPVKRGAND